jgi:hypothetical protein
LKGPALALIFVAVTGVAAAADEPGAGALPAGTTIMSVSDAASSTVFGAAPASAPAAVASSSTAFAPIAPAAKPKPGATKAKPKPAAKPEGPPVPVDELHKRAVVVITPTGYAAHIGKETGENLEIFLAWYIGTLYNEKGLFIAPIFSLYVGADAKWSFIGEKKYRPAVAAGYYGGLGVPFTGGAVRASSVATKSQVKQALMHNGYVSLSKRVGAFAFTAGSMYGIKKAFPLFIPMLRNGSFSTKPNPASDTMVTAFGGVDFSWHERHFKLEVITLPQETGFRPWLIQTHIDNFLGFDIAYLRDRIGYQVMGYYLLPFVRWPDKKRLGKEQAKIRERKP